MREPHTSEGEITTWSSSRLCEWITTVERDPAPDDAYWWWRVRRIAQSRAYDHKLSADERREWANAMLATSEREQHFGRVKPWDGALDRFSMRTHIIVNLGPVPGDETWDPMALAQDVIGTLTLPPERARELTEHWQTLPVEQMLLLRQHKNMLRSLVPELVEMLPDGDLATRVHEWLAIRPNLP
jgi:hypothetical protein